MCHYCGCRQLPLIRDYVAEHERATTLGGDAVRALDHLALEEGRRLLDAMHEELSSHWQGEENGIFAVMSKEPEYAAYIDPLVVEHRELEQLLRTADLAEPADRDRIRVAVADLGRAHQQGGGRALPRRSHRTRRRGVGRRDERLGPGAPG